MNDTNRKLFWAVVFVLGGAGLIYGAIRGNGRAYVERQDRAFQQIPYVEDDGTAITTSDGTARFEWVELEHEADGTPIYVADPATHPTRAWSAYFETYPREAADPDVTVSVPRTIGVWVAAFLTLFVLSFLYGDNPLYKMAESIVVGTSAAYVMVAAFWPNLVNRLMGSLTPGLIKGWAEPGLDREFNWVYIFPLILSVMLLWRLLPKGGWISRWPLAFFIGATAGFRLIGHLEADFVAQISNTILPLINRNETGMSGMDAFWLSVKNITIIIGVAVCLVYFFFSIEHTGIVGKTARVGIWFLMVTFGAAFGYTVMGRIALLAQRLEFLFDDWLWIIDPAGKRVVAMLVGM